MNEGKYVEFTANNNTISNFLYIPNNLLDQYYSKEPKYWVYCICYKNDDLKTRKVRDTIKNEFCKNNNINLIRIPWLIDGINSEGKLIQKLEDELLNYIPNIKEENYNGIHG